MHTVVDDEYMPAGHAEHSRAPPDEMVPSRQSTHAAWPDAYCEVPAAQAVHSDEPSPGALVPGAHGMHSA